MNSNSYFDSEFLDNNKGLIVIATSIILAFVTIYVIFIQPALENEVNSSNIVIDATVKYFNLNFIDSK